MMTVRLTPGGKRKARSSRPGNQAQQIPSRERGDRLLCRARRLADRGDQEGAGGSTLRHSRGAARGGGTVGPLVGHGS